jgi:hypothetical protein
MVALVAEEELQQQLLAWELTWREEALAM